MSVLRWLASLRCVLPAQHSLHTLWLIHAADLDRCHPCGCCRAEQPCALPCCLPQILFVINKPDVYKSPSSDTYVIFGEVRCSR